MNSRDTYITISRVTNVKTKARYSRMVIGEEQISETYVTRNGEKVIIEKVYATRTHEDHVKKTTVTY